MIIAIPAVTRYISESRKEAYVDTVKEIITTARIFNENCKSFTNSENGLTMKSTIEKLSQTDVSTNNTSEENPSTTYLRIDDYGNIRYIGSNPYVLGKSSRDIEE